MRLLRPEMAGWLFAIPVAVLSWLLHYRYKWRQRTANGADTTSRVLSRRTTARSDVLVLALSVVTLALLAGALMRPQIPAQRRIPTFDRRDLVLILDRSVSMRARDIQPSRFGRAIDEIRTFLRRKPASIDRVALVGFAGTSVVLSYATDDLGSLFFYLDWLREDPTPFFGTDIGAALTSALTAVRRDPQQVPPVFVLISDGDDQGGHLERAAAALTRANIRVHSIGVGSHESVPMPVPTGDGREEFLRDDVGRILTTRFDEGSLQRLATLTSGRYFRSTTGGELLTALESIALEERRQVGWTTRVEYRELYLALLAAAAAVSAGLVTRL